MGEDKRQEKRKDKMHVFEAKIASRGYHVFMNTTWTRAFVGEHFNVEIETNRESIRRDPYACAIRKTNRFFANGSETVGNIPRELSRHVYHFILFERGSVSGTVVSTQYRPSPIPAGVLEIPPSSPVCVSRPRHHPKDEMVPRKYVRLQFRMTKTTTKNKKKSK